MSKWNCIFMFAVLTLVGAGCGKSLKGDLPGSTWKVTKVECDGQDFTTQFVTDTETHTFVFNNDGTAEWLWNTSTCHRKWPQKTDMGDDTIKFTSNGTISCDPASCVAECGNDAPDMETFSNVKFGDDNTLTMEIKSLTDEYGENCDDQVPGSTAKVTLTKQ